MNTKLHPLAALGLVATTALAVAWATSVAAQPVRTAAPPPTPTLTAPTLSASAPAPVLPMKLPVFSALPPLCSEGQMLMLHDATQSKVHVCGMDTTASGPCVQSATRSHESCVASSACTSNGGRVNSAPAAVINNGCGLNEVVCVTSSQTCVRYQNVTTLRWRPL